MLERLKNKLAEFDMLGLGHSKDVRKSLIEIENDTGDISQQQFEANLRKIKELRQQQKTAEDKPAESE